MDVVVRLHHGIDDKMFHEDGKKKFKDSLILIAFKFLFCLVFDGKLMLVFFRFLKRNFTVSEVYYRCYKRKKKWLTSPLYINF